MVPQILDRGTSKGIYHHHSKSLCRLNIFLDIVENIHMKLCCLFEYVANYIYCKNDIYRDGILIITILIILFSASRPSMWQKLFE